MHEANMLWNNERRRVMVIDFDRAVLLPTPKHKQLFRLSEKKRNHKNNGLENYARKRPVPVSRYQGLAIDTMAQSITAECVPER
jgi:hypothetical protein